MTDTARIPCPWRLSSNGITMHCSVDVIEGPHGGHDLEPGTGRPIHRRGVATWTHADVGAYRADHAKPRDSVVSRAQRAGVDAALAAELARYRWSDPVVEDALAALPDPAIDALKAQHAVELQLAEVRVGLALVIADLAGNVTPGAGRARKRVEALLKAASPGGSASPTED